MTLCVWPYGHWTLQVTTRLLLSAFESPVLTNSLFCTHCKVPLQPSVYNARLKDIALRVRRFKSLRIEFTFCMNFYFFLGLFWLRNIFKWSTGRLRAVDAYKQSLEKNLWNVLFVTVTMIWTAPMSLSAHLVQWNKHLRMGGSVLFVETRRNGAITPTHRFVRPPLRVLMKAPVGAVTQMLLDGSRQRRCLYRPRRTTLTRRWP